VKPAASFVALLFLAISAANADDQPAYDVARITPGLRVKAPAIVREDQIRFDVVDRREAVETRTVAYTIFRKEGRDFGTLELPYDRFSSIDDFNGGLYDEHGKEIRELSRSDVKDESDITAFSLYQDARVRRGELFHDIYPYTVAFTYRIVHNGYISFPGWAAQPYREPVEHTGYEVVLPAAQELRYWTSDSSLQPHIRLSEGRRHYVWEASNLREHTDEELKEDVELRTAVVRTAPREFELDGHVGMMADWGSFGKWFAGLFRGKTLLPSDVAHEVDSLVSGIREPRERACVLYRYMQKKTRYVNITLGIGGYEPFDAAYVHQHGYGDCKALSNYMVALLSRAGIRAYPVLIYAGGPRSRTLENFPQSYFNHVIVCAPMARDSLWLECTSQEAPFGFLGDFTENRPALLITPEGGVLLRTPLTPSSGNFSHREGSVVLTATGAARGHFSIVRGGNFRGEVSALITHGDARRREQWVLREIGVNGTKLYSIGVSGVEERAPAVTLTTEVGMPYFGAASGSRVFFSPDFAQSNRMPSAECTGRRSPIRVPFPFVSTDSIRYSLPAGFKAEALPSLIELKASFGQYRSSTTALNDSTLLHVRFMEVRTPEIPAAHCEEYVQFMHDLEKADKSQAVVVKTK
jgi:transglutaminase-like putative cysteine protease